eukprot:gene9162-10751_t
MDSHFFQSGTWNGHTKDYNQFMSTVNLTGAYSIDALDLSLEGLENNVALDVLDVGCGTGSLTIPLAERVLRVPGSKVTAIDFSSTMVDALIAKAAEKNLDMEIKVMDGMNLSLPNDRFDLAYSAFALMFFPSRDKGFAEMYRVLKPGGKGVVLAWSSNIHLPKIIKDSYAAVLPSSPFPEHLTNILTFGEPLEFEQQFLNAGFSSAKCHLVSRVFNVPNAFLCRFFLSNPVFQSVAKTIPETLVPSLISEFEKRFSTIGDQISNTCQIGVAIK